MIDTNRRARRLRERPPAGVVALALLAIVFFALPFLGLLWKVPWSDVGRVLGKSEVRTALWLSIRTSVASALLAGFFGIPLAWLLARTNFPGRNFVRALCTMSMVLPPVVGGVALFFSFGRRGLFGQYLDQWFSFQLTFTVWGVIVAQTFVAMPFLVLTVEAAIRQADARYEDAARTLGATRSYVFRRITLPAIRPALLAGFVLAWARALGEFGATITFAGNFPGTTQTISIATFLALETDQRDALVLSVVMIATSFAVLL
ncbi:MAG: molybdate ABC transporter permease subunit, partial [Actinobacteria bacterium]|nr:molybdate ABC transporter permease subunit [Actinomycetota bacterium]